MIILFININSLYKHSITEQINQPILQNDSLNKSDLINLFSKDEIISGYFGCLPNHNSTFLIFADYLYNTYGFSLFILLYKSMYSANILNLNSYGCDGSIFYSTSPSSPFYGSFFMCGWRNAKYSVFLMFSISSCNPSSVIRILSALNKLITSKE